LIATEFCVGTRNLFGGNHWDNNQNLFIYFSLILLFRLVDIFECTRSHQINAQQKSPMD
jgi:hypothetical protein